MSGDVGAVAQQGIVSTQIQQVQNDQPAPEPPKPPVAATEAPQETKPPAGEGRGQNVDVSA